MYLLVPLEISLISSLFLIIYIGEVNIADKFNVSNSIKQSYFKKRPVKTKTVTNQKLSKLWIIAFLCSCIERKQQLHTNILINPSLLNKFKIYRKTFCNLINTAIKSYCHKIFESAIDIETTWRRIYSVYHPSLVKLNLKLTVNNKLVTDSTEHLL